MSQYDLFNDTMNTVSITSGAGGGGVWGVQGISGTYGTSSTGTAGQTLTWNGTDTIWTTPRTELEDDIKDLRESIENIEKRLAILHPNKELENSWEELKALGERYRELEKDILEKEKIWDILKK
jgi:hypothetical protein